MRRIVFGAGGFGSEVMRLAKTDSIETIFAHDGPAGSFMNTPLISFGDSRPDDKVIIAVGDPSSRKAIFDRYKDLLYDSLYAETAIIGDDVKIGEGAIFCDYTLVTSSAVIGKHFQCNIYSYVAHDCVIGDFVTFAPRVSCNGRVHIEDGVYIGTGAVIREGSDSHPIIIGKNSIVGMGAVVTKSVPANVTVIGNPARPK